MLHLLYVVRRVWVKSWGSPELLHHCRKYFRRHKARELWKLKGFLFGTNWCSGLLPQTPACGMDCGLQHGRPRESFLSFDFQWWYFNASLNLARGAGRAKGRGMKAQRSVWGVQKVKRTTRGRWGARSLFPAAEVCRGHRKWQGSRNLALGSWEAESSSCKSLLMRGGQDAKRLLASQRAGDAAESQEERGGSFCVFWSQQEELLSYIHIDHVTRIQECGTASQRHQ